ncbi:MAG: hypothetical protein UU65_C0008G0008 [candidate division CPR2 bacterium GW2011_GWC1_41_48]|uniref:Uncharacterized protein n=1 Tax=candidate division CPR2 bacterium GW2011_GWC1_41_48 TaxID=1618344 RepID=A0A0G0YGA3_UNCC2|nr:MAG: hypothetical protein UT47_C0008G0008 [candidate division CPR2 bacterium GW2011_GWC2_39_35]KKR27739.1 MAG: hypothetical protein UT60_C0038G0003 [candidate division CPR2 bacterium GW2011_GWD2_39_7]KKS08586.1 MAG: hypothetical protein UU65_C0008G0008 [candidate division CPR2 bacterium GW2011_GWC1_41_48]OGB71803.1 MAG: hypothetical protein A2Y26_03945 [candidate division CPR2 bacterium GWD2_39_7]HCL99843.1 histidine kinase [candidate division CPR2 bacterium]
MDIKDLITKKIREKGTLKVSDIVDETGFSRAFIQRFFKELQNEGKIILVGRANRAHYVLRGKAKEALKNKVIWDLKNRDLNEDIVWNKIKRETAILADAPENITKILGYAFTVMLNNAIEHSEGTKIRIIFSRDKERILFDISDNGIGIFNNIVQKKKLKNIMEAIQDLLKGKQTTSPEAHSGEGIFFTSKMADRFVIYGSGKKIIFDNSLKDIFVSDNPNRKGTRVFFEIGTRSERNLEDIFREYADESFEFAKTKVVVRLYEMGREYISRSQARRVVSGLDEFKHIVLDFDRVQTVGQGFADEVFRVWQKNNPDIRIEDINTNENVELMINRVRSGI